LARSGVLRAVKFARNWMTTHDAVRDYIAEHGAKAGAVQTPTRPQPADRHGRAR
jgi:hypothetical protein